MLFAKFAKIRRTQQISVLWYFHDFKFLSIDFYCTINTHIP